MTKKKGILRAWTFWIRTHERELWRQHLEATRLKELRAAPGNLRAAALFRDRGDGATEVVLASLWISIESVQAFVGSNPLDPGIEAAEVDNVFEFEPTVRQYAVTDLGSLVVVPTP